MSNLRFVIFSIFSLIHLLFAQTTIAVIDFDARSISDNEVATLTDRFRDELTKTNQYTVVERGMIEEVLKEQGFQQSGCTSDECIVEVGQIIGVQQMVGGSIGKVGNVFTISARIIDVESGKILNVTNYDHIGDIGMLLTSGMRNAVQQLLDVTSNRPSQGVEDSVKSDEYTNRAALKQTGTVTDIDGNVYRTVKIGDQWWMAENLKVTKYRNGEEIPNVTENRPWGYLTSGIYCNYNNDSINVATYGRLYNLYAVNEKRNIAPEGWHVPTNHEWQTLVDYLGGSYVAGGKLKEVGTEHWLSPNTGATNESGFTALPGGYRGYTGSFYDMGSYTIFWSSSIFPRRQLLNYNSSGVTGDDTNKQNGFSVRCVRD